MLRRSLLVVLILASAHAARAQIIDSGRRSFGQPEAWTSLSIGWLSLQTMCDPDSGACWDFGGAPQWRASLEFPMGRGATFGGAATTARVPLIYNDGGVSCAGNCDADANVSQYMAQLHLGGGGTLQQSIDVNAGVAVFSNFRSTTGTKLGGKAVTNAMFSIGLGLAYPLSRTFHLTLSQDLGLVIGKRMAGLSENNAELTTLRIGARLGLGG